MYLPLRVHPLRRSACSGRLVPCKLIVQVVGEAGCEVAIGAGVAAGRPEGDTGWPAAPKPLAVRKEGTGVPGDTPSVSGIAVPALKCWECSWHA